MVLSLIIFVNLEVEGVGWGVGGWEGCGSGRPGRVPPSKQRNVN